ncbi:MAG: deoxyadenosine kinase [Myxococcota bacterium]|jgi:deoxyadenosine kinase
MTQATTRKPFIGIAGLIGVGKSTLAKKLGEHLGLDTYYEPVADNAYLADFYTDTARYSFAMQVYLLNRRFKQHQEIIWRSRGAVQDRTIYEDSIFAKVLRDMNLMHERDYETYLELFSNMSNFMCRPTAIVYLDARPETSMARINARSRSVESGITLEYLQQLRGEYEAFVQEISHTIPVIRVPWEAFVDTERVADAITSEIEQASYMRDVKL